MNWENISDNLHIEELIKASEERPVMIFKHSTRCSISDMVKNRLERETAPEGISFYFLDLIQHRDLSNRISERFSVHHESPQVLLIRNGECIYDESHNAISMAEIAENARAR